MKKIIIVSLFFLMVTPLLAQTGEVFTTDEGAIRGYDPVAYFQHGKPVKGKKEYTWVWNSAPWSFATKENLEAFKASPEKYAPQYGGYCAYGTSQGHKAPTQPDAWTIVNGKLYFNYNKSVQATWTKDQQQLIKKADENWPSVKTQ
jgi:YHS domain-containing protein